MGDMRWQGALAIGDGEAAGVLANPYFFGVNSFSDPLTKEFNKADRASGDRSMHRMVEVARDISGSFEVECDPNILAYLLKYTLGTVNSAEDPVASGEYKHEFTMNESGPSTFSLYVRRGKEPPNQTSRYIYNGCKINTLTLRAAAAEKLIATVDWVANEYVDALVNVETFADLELIPFVFNQLTTYRDDNLGAGVSFPDCEGFEVVIANNLVVDKRTSNLSLYPQEFPVEKLDVTGNWSRENNETTEWDKFLAETERRYKFEFAGASMGTNPYTCDIDIPRAHLREVDRGDIGGGGGRQTQVVSFDALRDFAAPTGDDREIYVLVRNELTSPLTP